MSPTPAARSSTSCVALSRAHDPRPSLGGSPELLADELARLASPPPSKLRPSARPSSNANSASPCSASIAPAKIVSRSFLEQRVWPSLPPTPPAPGLTMSKRPRLAAPRTESRSHRVSRFDRRHRRCLHPRPRRLSHGRYLRYGKGRHPAALNLGDCFACATAATARTAGQRLLYLGGRPRKNAGPPPRENSGGPC